ncbi:hypothetical protein FALBO_904 [Fusarium albosuccineum]|uniref:Xylanolytic transcriptional activator regulatory domain-containing protein n=1 Tax=Fusarium albosuccineum TaxID=1237068 RepID=A0A8H4LPX0_9HYPO|nr:hypothetical protein FALBO_904 [Fusarium albosuccineum]
MTSNDDSPRDSAAGSEVEGDSVNPSSVSVSSKRQRKTKSTAYIDDLVAENQRLRSRDGDSKPRTELIPSDVPIAATNGQAEASSTLQGTLLEERPWFFDMNVLHTPVLIGEASDVAFASRFRQAISEPGHSHIPRVNYAPDDRLLALSDADCPWPIPSRARLLVNVALKYVSRCYYIVRKSQILEGLEQTIQNPHSTDSLLKSKLWALFAIGEMYSTRTAAKEKNFPGMAYFARATRVLRIISERPRIDAIEIRLLLSFYSLALNRRYTAYALAGSSVRLSVVMGLHLNVPESQLRDAGAREHRNRVWWTAYSFDRMWASRLSHPVAIQDDDIEVDLPSDPVLETPSDDFADSAYFIASISLAKLSARIINSIYTRKPQQKTLSQRVAITATRPILLHVLRTHVTAWETQPRAEPQIPASAVTLSEACVRCARHSCRLLIDCWIDGSFATFDYFYTQYLFAAATVLAISSLLDGKECRSDKEQFESAAQFLAQLKENGNFAAEEFCRHIDAMKVTMATMQSRRGDFTLPDANLIQLDGIDVGAALTDANPTAGMALAEPSLQELLSQPVLDLQFIDASMYHDGSQGLYWPDISPESWTANAWTPT